MKSLAAARIKANALATIVCSICDRAQAAVKAQEAEGGSGLTANLAVPSLPTWGLWDVSHVVVVERRFENRGRSLDHLSQE